MDIPSSAPSRPSYASQAPRGGPEIGLVLTAPRLVSRAADLPFTVEYKVPSEWHAGAFKRVIPNALIGVAINQATGESDATHFRRDYEMNPVKFDRNPEFPEPSGTGFVSGSIALESALYMRLLKTPGPYWAYVVLGPLVSNVVAFTVKPE
jgi:hypothetical protein